MNHIMLNDSNEIRMNHKKTVRAISNKYEIIMTSFILEDFSFNRSNEP